MSLRLGPKNIILTMIRLAFGWLMPLALLLMIAIVAVFLYGNPQWHKQIYIFRAYVYPGIPPHPPENFTGTWIEWQANGNPLRRASYYEGKLCGEFTEWSTVGKVAYKQNYVVREEVPKLEKWQRNVYKLLNDQPPEGYTGTWTEYFPNKKKKRLRSWKNGKAHGVWKSWHPSGALRWTFAYENGRRTGPRVISNPDGTKNMSWFYNAGKAEGKWEHFGDTSSTVIYKNGKVSPQTK